MVSSGVRQALKLVAAIVALAAQAAAPPYAVAADAERQRAAPRNDPRDPFARRRIFRRSTRTADGADRCSIKKKRTTRSPRSSIERARQVVRVNNGLHTLEQVPLIKQLFRIEEARGNHAAAWDLEQELLTLVRRYPDDLRTVPVLHEIADRQMDVLATYLAGESRRSSISAASTNRGRRAIRSLRFGQPARPWCRECSPRRNETTRTRSRSCFATGFTTARSCASSSMKLLRGVDMVRTVYDDDPRREALPLRQVLLGTTRDRAVAQPHGADPRARELGLPYPSAGSQDDGRAREARITDPYHRGRQSLRRLYAYDAASSRPPLSQADAVVQMADWDLLYSHHGRAIEGYALVRACCERAGVADASIEQLFSPPIPVVLPAFQPNPLARDDDAGRDGSHRRRVRDHEVRQRPRCRDPRRCERHARRAGSARGPDHEQPFPAAADGRRCSSDSARSSCATTCTKDRTQRRHDRAVRQAVPSRPPAAYNPDANREWFGSAHSIEDDNG